MLPREFKYEKQDWFPGRRKGVPKIAIRLSQGISQKLSGQELYTKKPMSAETLGKSD
jgi:hypothetical protein